MRLTSHPLSRLLKMAVVMTAAYSSTVVAANCTFTGNNLTKTANFGTNLAGKSLTVAADVPNGKVIYQDSVQVEGQSWGCTATSLYGLVSNPSLGAPVHQSTVGKTGLSCPRGIGWWSLMELPVMDLRLSHINW